MDPADVLDHLPVGVYVLDGDDVVYANRRATQLLGDAMVGRRAHTFHHAPDGTVEPAASCRLCLAAATAATTGGQRVRAAAPTAPGRTAVVVDHRFGDASADDEGLTVVTVEAVGGRAAVSANGDATSTVTGAISKAEVTSGRMTAVLTIAIEDVGLARSASEAIADRLRETLRPTDVIHRTGPAEFVAVCADVADMAAARAIATRCLDGFRAPFPLGSRHVTTNVAIGIAAVTSATHDAGEVLAKATAAAATARARADRVAVYRDSDLTLARDLDDAIALGQLRARFQPEVSLRTRRLVGFEALVRWEHPTQGSVSPVEFVPLAEETGAIVPLGEWMLGQAVTQAATWRRARPGGHLLMSVNVSGAQLATGDALVDAVARVLQSTATPPGQVCLEITESVLMSDLDAAIGVLHHLRALGVLIAIDDFGTGHSSFSYLRDMPVNVLKVDKSFVDGLGTSPEARPIVDSIVKVARTLGLTTVAEGVERSDQAAILQGLGCELGQGYLFARPLPADELTPMVVNDVQLGVPAKRSRAAHAAPSLVGS